MAVPVRYMPIDGPGHRSLVLDTLHSDFITVCECNSVEHACRISDLLNEDEGYQIRPIGSEAEAFEKATHRHYKGGLYRVLRLGTHTETKEEMVIYEHLWPHDRVVLVRPKSIWDSPVEGSNLIRFSPLG